MAFKMKGSPMKRNFGLNSPIKQGWNPGPGNPDDIDPRKIPTPRDEMDHPHSDHHPEERPDPNIRPEPDYPTFGDSATPMKSPMKDKQDEDHKDKHPHKGYMSEEQKQHSQLSDTEQSGTWVSETEWRPNTPNKMKSPMKDQKAGTRRNDIVAHREEDHQHNWNESTPETVYPELFPDSEESKKYLFEKEQKRLRKKKWEQEMEGSATPMKSPLEQTDWWDKIKSAGEAIYSNIGKVHGHGNKDSMYHNVMRDYDRIKKGYREEDKREEMESATKMKSPMKDTQYFGEITTAHEANRVTKHNKKHKSGEWDDDHKKPAPKFPDAPGIDEEGYQKTKKVATKKTKRVAKKASKATGLDLEKTR